jgi:hypothetical protein
VEKRLQHQYALGQERERRRQGDLRQLLADAFSSVEFVPFSMTIDKILDDHGHDRMEGEPWSWWIAGVLVRGLSSGGAP